jgi:hypothetical protein
MREEETEALHRPGWVHAHAAPHAPPHAPRPRPRSTGAARARPPTVGPRWLGGCGLPTVSGSTEARDAGRAIGWSGGFPLGQHWRELRGMGYEWPVPAYLVVWPTVPLRGPRCCAVRCGAVQLGPGECNAASLYLVLRRRCHGWSSGPSGAVGLPAPPPSADGSWWYASRYVLYCTVR